MRIQVNLSEEMVQKLDFYSNKLGVSRSALCSIMIGNGVLSYDKAMDVIDSLPNKVDADSRRIIAG